MVIHIDSVQSVLTLVATVAGLVGSVGYTTWQIIIYRQLTADKTAINSKQDEIDAVDADVTARTTGHLVTESQRQAQVAAGRAPLLRDLKRLKEDRDSIKDKLLFAKK